MAETEPGCYVDSHHGHYAVPMLIEWAAATGFPVDPFVRYALDNYDHDYHNESYPNEALIEVSDEAINWLNENRSIEGHSWGWQEGDFGLWPDETDDDG